jgi:hypothetical protein
VVLLKSEVRADFYPSFYSILLYSTSGGDFLLHLRFIFGHPPPCSATFSHRNDLHNSRSTAWAAIINSVDENGVSDIVLTVAVLVFFSLGSILGFFEFARLGGITMLALTGGLSIGIRVVLMREGLLLHGDSLYAVNWVIVGAFAVLHGLALVWLQRVVIVSESLLL